MGLPIGNDSLTGVPVARITSGDGNFMIPYYTARASSADGQLVVCTGETDGNTQAWLFDLQDGKGRRVSDVPGGILTEACAFHPDKPWVFYASERSAWWYDIQTDQTQLIFTTNDPFRIKSELSCGREHLVFWIYEHLSVGRDRHDAEPGGFYTTRNCRSYVMAVHIASGAASVVWGDTSPLTHPVINPCDENTILYANQGVRTRLQELFTIHRTERDNRQPVRLYRHYDQQPERPIYMGHSFFTYDGWVGCQMNDFGGRQQDGMLSDIVAYNAIIRPDGTCDRRARYPGGNKPMHCHAAYADSWWVGDTLPSEGGNDGNVVSIMKNNWETGFVQAEALCIHGCSHERPYHVHPQITPDEKRVLFNSDWGGHCHVYVAYLDEYLANWRDAVSFEPRPARFYQSYGNMEKPTAGPPV